MRRAGAPDFSDEDWEQLSPKLDAEYRRRWRVLPLWWLGALSGLLLCSNIGWWWMWQQAEHRSEAMQTEWQQVRRESVMLRDTSWTKVVVYQYDTIYRSIVYRTAIGSNLPLNAAASGAENTTGLLTKKAANLEAPVEAGTETVKTAVPMEEKTAAKDGENPRTQGFNTSGVVDLLPSKLSLLLIPPRAVEMRGNALVVTPTKRASKPQVQIPRKFRVGAGAGLVMPSADHLSNNIGFLTYLTGEIAFSDQLALTLEGGYAGVSFKGTVYDEGLGLPPEKSPGDDFKLKHFEVEEGVKPIFQLTGGMRYWLRARHKLSPYVGIGYAIQWHPGFELKAEYQNTVTGQEKEVTTELATLARPVSLLDMNAGLRYRFSPHWYWQTGAVYQFKLEANQPGIPRFFGLKSSVLFEF